MLTIPADEGASDRRVPGRRPATLAVAVGAARTQRLAVDVDEESTVGSDATRPGLRHDQRGGSPLDVPVAVVHEPVESARRLLYPPGIFERVEGVVHPLLLQPRGITDAPGVDLVLLSEHIDFEVHGWFSRDASV